jgi:hypothetical protein
MKVGDRVEIVDQAGSGFPVGTKGTIVDQMRTLWVVSDGKNQGYFLPERLKLLPSEVKGQCLTDANQELYTALKGLLDTAIRVENHLVVHPYQLALVEAIHVAQEAIDKAENGETEEKQVECGQEVIHRTGITVTKSLYCRFCRTICPVCHTNHEV